ncbi:hypothetical protein IWW48_003540 [Coemansia sp. RSA 1200]|nr:hypothetical protein IWW48_003540 [Coemansia sp. RSA 1200]
MLPCRRTTLLSCCQLLPPPLPVSLSGRKIWRGGVADADDIDDDDDDDAVFNVWAPLCADPRRSTASASSNIGGRVVGSKARREDAEGDSVWRCPEIDHRARAERARRRRALRVAEKMDAMVQAARTKRRPGDGDEDGASSAKRSRGDSDADSGVDIDVKSAVRRSDALHANPWAAGSVSVAPQSLLMPELLPKEVAMAMSRLPHHAERSSRQTPQPPSPASDGPADVDETSGASAGLDLDLDLGLDLGDAVSRRSTGIASRRGQLQPQSLSLLGASSRALESGAAAAVVPADDVSASIREITSFLERDVDVFTPLSAFAGPLSSLAKPTTDAADADAAKRGGASAHGSHSSQELIDDILGFRL